jgi:uncharacterized protein YegJ (DUF2314 family)
MEWNQEMDCKQLRKVQTFLRIELIKLQKVLKMKQKKKERKCQHIWIKDMSARGGRSHYDCKKCGLYR